MDGPRAPPKPVPGDPRDLPTRSSPRSDAPVDDIASADTMLDPDAEKAAPPVLVGEVLADRYRILSEVGRGGEGVVYRALDLRADSVVALKLLQRGAERLGRYRRELQMARKVTHPNVVRIHDLVDLPARFGLSMELVEGEALDERLARSGPMSTAELASLAHDLASALAAAHAAGVTHRDLKPANVLLRSDGSGAVVTDFGISRLHAATDSEIVESVRPAQRRETAAAAAGAGAFLPLTSEGALVGTPLYMAPEQLEGRTDIGPAADVYAFGLVVREAATGVRLHEDATLLGDLRAARRTPPPPLGTLRPDLAPAFAAVVDRCLSFEAKDRPADGRALLVRLEGAASRRRPVGLLLALAGVGAAVAVVLASVRPWGMQRRATAGVPAPPPSSPPVQAAPVGLTIERAHRVAFGEGCQEFPSFFPDGDAIAYDATVGSDSYVYTMSLGSGAPPRAITHVTGWDIAPEVSPDGKRVAFLRIAGADKATFVVDATGAGEPRRIAGGRVRPTWSADGRAIWAGESRAPTLFDADTGAALRTIALPDAVLTSRVLDDGDLDLILSLRNREVATQGVAASGRGPFRWLFEGDADEVLALAPGGRHVLVSRSLVARNMELMAVPLEGGPATSLATSGIQARKGLQVSRDGKRVVWSTCGVRTDIARVRAAGPATAQGAPELEPLPGQWEALDHSLVPLPGSRSIAVLSMRDGPSQPWIIDRAGRAPPRLVPLEAADPMDLDASPDGAWLVIQSARGLRLLRIDGSVPERVLTREEHDMTPRFGSSGRQIFFARRLLDAGGMAILSIPIEGGTPTVIIPGGASWPAPSPGGRVAYFAGGETTSLTPRVRDLATGRDAPLSAQLPAGAYSVMTWSRDGRRVALLRGVQEIVEVDAATGSIVRSVRGAEQFGDIRYDGADLLVARYGWDGGVWLGDARWN